MIDKFEGQHAFLSNFYYANVNIHGISYPTSEHAYQAFKTNDVPTRVKLSQFSTPKEAKRAGRLLPLRRDWEALKFDVMRMVVHAKFTQNASLAALLLSTGDQELIEGNWWGDTVWGVCKGEGENHLGRILMDARRWIVL